MRFTPFKMLAFAAVTGLLLVPAQAGLADDSTAGLSRISDAPAEPAPAATPRLASAAATSTTQPIGPVGYGSHYQGYHGHGGGTTYTHWPRAVFPWLVCNGYCTYSPDHGWSTIQKHPIYRQDVEYYRYHASAFYGAGLKYAAAYPTVYTPTDTTQLGYYYQHVPHWRPMPGALPAPPVPANWHIRGPAYGAHAGIGAGVVVAEPHAQPVPTPAVKPERESADDELERDAVPPPAPPADLQNSARNWRIERVRY